MTYFSVKVEISHFILPKAFLVIGSPIIHRVEDRAHGFTGFAERIFHARRNLRVYGSRDYAIVLHGAQAVRENLLADSLKIFLKFIESPWSFEKISHNEQLPFAADKLYCGRYRTFRQFFLGQHKSTSLNIGYL